MTTSTTSHGIAARCVSVDRRGPLHHVLIRHPGTDRFVTWSTSGEGEVQRHIDDATALLAAFVDLGLAHERARREVQGHLEPLTDKDRHDLAATLIELRAERDSARARCAQWEQEASETYGRLCRALDLPEGTTTGEIVNRARLFRLEAEVRHEAIILPRPSDLPWVPARHDHDRHDDDDGDCAGFGSGSGYGSGSGSGDGSGDCVG